MATLNFSRNSITRLMYWSIAVMFNSAVDVWINRLKRGSARPSRPVSHVAPATGHRVRLSSKKLHPVLACVGSSRSWSHRMIGISVDSPVNNNCPCNIWRVTLTNPCVNPRKSPIVNAMSLYNNLS